MSEDADKDSKTFEPTQKKIQDAKKKGQTTRSKELSNFITLLASALVFIAIAYGDNSAFKDWFQYSFTIEQRHLYSMGDFTERVAYAFFDAAILVLIFSVIVGIAAMFGNIIIGGWVFAPNNALPKMNKVNPLKGIQRMFSKKTVVELVKSILKIVLLGAIAFFFMSLYQSEISALSQQTIGVLATYVLETSVLFFTLVSMALIFVVIIDAPYQFYEHRKNLMMTHEEIKRENKEQEGDPHLKGKLRQRQREMAMGRMMDDVPTADVVVTNPTHYSIALKYEEGKHNAPVVVASGVDTIAFKIREVANENNVLIVESPELARSMYRFVDIGDQIPEALFDAVAQIIMFIRQLDELNIEQKQQGLDIIEEIRVPDGLRYNGE